MDDAVVIREPLPADHLEIAALIEGLVPRYLARELTPEGIAIVREAAQPGVIGARLGGLKLPVWSPAMVAVAGRSIVGFGAVRDATHITQLQIHEAWHGRGIGHRLARALIAEIGKRQPQAHTVTLNASAAGFLSYLRMGFVPVGPRFNWRGIVAQPMEIRI
jgi:ribosomal protein S18 acetylase RimI-like enzyme